MRLPRRINPPTMSKSKWYLVRPKSVDPVDKPIISGISGKEQHKQARNTAIAAAA